MKKKVLALFMAVSLASTSLPMTALATETGNVSRQEEMGIAENSETTEESKLTEADNEKESAEEPESTETQKKAEATETIEQQGTVEVTEVTEQPETKTEATAAETTETLKEPETAKDSDTAKEQDKSAKTATNKKQNKSETLEVETEEADKQGISIEEVLKNRAGGFVPAQGIALSEAEAGRFKEISPDREQDIPAYGSAVYHTEWDKYSSNYIYNNLNSGERKFWDALDHVCLSVSDKSG